MTQPDGNPADLPAEMRLQRYLARCGVASRRQSEELITAGRVSVNGVIECELGTKVIPGTDEVRVDGKPITQAQEDVYLILNKPAGYLTTMDDPQGRPTIAPLVPLDRYPGLFPVGRLDYDTTGLLLFMTDGPLAFQLLHPRYHVEKRYIAVVDGRLFDSELQTLRRGMKLDDGPCKPAKVEILEEGPTTRVACTIAEGRKRQVKRMFKAIGHPVLCLDRVTFGPLELGELPLGKWRLLEDNEIDALRAAVVREKER